jgi:ferredoxin
LKRIGVPALAAAVLTALLLGVVQWKVARPMLLAERFVTHAGWLEVASLALYAGALTHHILDIRQSAKWRRRLWATFSIVFFGQLALGLVGFETFLMTGKLHIPVPAMILAGPVYRGHSFFMPMLCTITVVLLGPAWCSYLCYIGAWDSGFAHLRKRPVALPRWRRFGRPAILVLVVVTAFGLRCAGVRSVVATAAGIAFGLVGVLLMALWSRRTGVMAHCLSYCPMGWLATALGKVSPFRLRIQPGCTECGACIVFCRYDALSMDDIQHRRPGASCTLCGDCQRACHERFLEYRLLGLGPHRDRAVFMVMVVSLHATFLGVARI